MSESNVEPELMVAPWRLRLVLLLVGALCLVAFLYGNSHTEAFRLRYPRFEPWLWNLLLTTSLLSLVGLSGMYWCHRWGFWLLLAMAGLAILVSTYAMGLSLVAPAAALAVAAVWFSAQPEWKAFR